MRSQAVFDVVKCAVWGSEPCKVDAQLYEEMRCHTIAALPAGVLSHLIMPYELFLKWQTYVYQQISFNLNYQYEQANLPLAVPYVILKGSAAAKYYPRPELRAMGDIDIMTHREDYEKACEELLSAGFQELSDDKNPRHRIFKKDSILVEVHYYFASLNVPEQAQYMDNLIIDNINQSHYLPDLENGLVLLEHISQHLEGGLGLRQIIDWMMFVDKCLPDEKWHEFEALSVRVGLEKLAVIATRMCEIYLGMPERNWTLGADEKLCEQLMEYILDSGNFGNKQTSDEDIGKNVFAYGMTPKAAFTLLRERGLINWHVAQNHRFLRPFAWVYQGFRYLKRGLSQEKALQKLKEEYRAAKKKNALLDALNVKTRSKGIVRYRNGKYIKES